MQNTWREWSCGLFISEPCFFPLFLDFSRANIGEVGGVKRGFCNHKHFWMSFHQQTVRESALLGRSQQHKLLNVFFLLNAVSSEWSSLRGENGWRLKDHRDSLVNAALYNNTVYSRTRSTYTHAFRIHGSLSGPSEVNQSPLCTEYTVDAFLIPLISLMLWNGFDWWCKNVFSLRNCYSI